MSWILPIFWIVVFLLLLWKLPFFKLNGIPQSWMLGVFTCRLAASVCFFILYTYYYTDVSDTIKYQRDAEALFESIYHNPLDYLKILLGIGMDSPSIQQYIEHTDHWTRLHDYGWIVDNQTITRANMIILLFSWGNDAVHYVCADFLSMLAFTLIFKSLTSFSSQNKLMFVFVFLMPSCILWTATMLKEIIVFLGIGLTFYATTRLCNKFSTKHVFLLALGWILLFSIKIYIIVALLPALCGFILQQKMPAKKDWTWYAILGGAGCLLLILADPVFHVVNFFESLAGKRTDFINTAILNDAESYIPIQKIEPTLLNFIIHTPEALWNAISRPYIWEIHSLIQIIPTCETLLFFILLILMGIFPYKQTSQTKNLLWFSVCFMIILYWIIGMTTPVSGAIVRYKIPVFPFLYTTFALFIDWNSIKHLIKKYRYGSNTSI